jgi:hypothetical protein
VRSWLPPLPRGLGGAASLAAVLLGVPLVGAADATATVLLKTSPAVVVLGDAVGPER